MSRPAQLTSLLGRRALRLASRFIVVSPFLLGRFGGPSSTLKAEITAPAKSPAPVEVPAIVSEPAYGSRIEPGLLRNTNAQGKTPCNRRGSTADWYKAIVPATNIPLDAVTESSGFGHDNRNESGVIASNQKSRTVGPLAVRAARGVPIA